MTEIRPMEFTRLGIIDLFGILTPGVFLLGNIILIFDRAEIFDAFLTKILANPLLAIVVILFVGYLLGSILRLISPKRVDSLVSVYLKIRYRKKIKEIGPKRNSLIFTVY